MSLAQYYWSCCVERLGRPLGHLCARNGSNFEKLFRGKQRKSPYTVINFFPFIEYAHVLQGISWSFRTVSICYFSAERFSLWKGRTRIIYKLFEIVRPFSRTSLTGGKVFTTICVEVKSFQVRKWFFIYPHVGLSD